jgi:hypothetical protein
VAAPRLLILADPKMLPALANGLREGGRFDVLPVPLSDGGAAAAAAPRADAVVVFYGAPGRPLASTVQMLGAAVRGKGGRIVAVLQREAVAQRDECFRAGASDLLFMPMSKDQFVNRLEGAVALAYSPGPGPLADVQVSSRTAQVKLSRAVVTPAGVHAPTGVPFLPGETVRLSLEVDGTPLQAWGLVAANGPEVRIRFAGLAPEEEARFREWAKKHPAGAPAAPEPSRPAPPAGPTGSPQSGPPPGFADRPRVRPDASAPAAAPRPKAPEPPPPMLSRSVVESELPTPPMVPPLDLLETPPTSPPVAAVPDGETNSPAASAVENSIFTPASVEAVAPVVEPVVWPVPVPLESARSAVLAALFSPDEQPAVSQEVILSAKKIAAALSGSEKAAIERLGAESHFADAAGERVVLDIARAEGTRLAAASEPSKVDDAAVKSLAQRVDAVVASLQKEADGAITRGEVEALQVVRASSAALSRELLALKAIADRLRGLAAAPRLGSGALDPDVILSGQAPSARPPPPRTAEAPVRAELKEFAKFQEVTSASRKRTTLIVFVVALVAAAAYVLFFTLPQIRSLDPKSTNIPGVVRVEIGGTGARVLVSDSFAEKPEPSLSLLISLLREKNVSSAVLFNVSGAPVGQIDVKTGATTGIAAPKKGSGAPR